MSDGMECIPQNDDCSLKIFTKAASVAAAAFNTATAGVFNALFSQYKSAKQGFLCHHWRDEIAHLLSAIHTNAGDVEELLTVANQSNVVLFDIPIATIVKQAITNSDQILSSATNVLGLLTNSCATNSTADTSVDELQDLIDSNSMCGYQLKNLTDHVIAKVTELRNAAIDDIRVIVSNSSIVLNDIPTATNNCMRELLANKTSDAAFETRDLLRKTFGVIIDQLIETATTDLGASVKEDDYMLEVANMGLTGAGRSGTDRYRVHGVAVCSADVRPHLVHRRDRRRHTVRRTGAFDRGRSLCRQLRHVGDGIMNLIFESTETKDVTVVIYSGGDRIAEVDVNAGETATWNASISTLQGAVMYLDRWRADVIGIPGSGGGSLVLWIPRVEKGGNEIMHVRINVS